MLKLLLIAPKGSYLTAGYREAAKRINAEIIVASEGDNSLVDNQSVGLRVDFQDLFGSLDTIKRFHSLNPFDGVLGTDDSALELAAFVATSLKLPGNQPDSIKAGVRKDLSREIQLNAGLPTPWFHCVDLRNLPLLDLPDDIPYPCIAKPVTLSASRGVIRANNKKELLAALIRIRRIIESAGSQHPLFGLIEEYIPGEEYVVEGFLFEEGAWETLAIFSKPDYMSGPFFEETIYVSSSTLDIEIERGLIDLVHSACRSYGLRHGPVHAECRINDRGTWLIELAPRTIGGRCGKILQTNIDQSLEEIIILNALGKKPFIKMSQEAVGAMMIPVPGSGILRRVEGIENAKNVNYIDDIQIDVQPGQRLIPWPEGSPYPGFIFARGPDGEAVTRALRDAHARLRFVLGPELPLIVNS